MTTVYGVTYVGARDQIEKQLKDLGNIPEEDCWLAACYLAHVVLGCIGNLFSGAKAIQNWLNLCARLISKSIPEERIPELMSEYIGIIDRQAKVPEQTEEAKEDTEIVKGKEDTETAKGKEDTETAKSETAKSETAQVDKPKAPKRRGKKRHVLPMDLVKKEQMASVRWTTPLGLPIVQPYRKTVRKQVMTALQTVYISDPNLIAEGTSVFGVYSCLGNVASAVNSVKQASAFPPNYIHSLDATHMILTALECKVGCSSISVLWKCVHKLRSWHRIRD